MKLFLGYEKVPFGYEKKPIFANFPFHTLGYENIGCFFLMHLVVPLESWRHFVPMKHDDGWDPLMGWWLGLH